MVEHEGTAPSPTIGPLMKQRTAGIVLVSALSVGAVSTLALTPALAATTQAASHRLTDLKTAEASYQAALYATAQTNRQSLVNFLS